MQKTLVAPGALLAVLSGLMLTFSVTSAGRGTPGFNIWLMIMQGAGLVGALIVLGGAADGQQAGAAGPDGPGAA